MIKKSLLLGAVSGLLAGIASVIYQKVYASSLGEDFATIAKPVGIVMTSVIGGLIAGVGYWLIDRLLKGKGEIYFNLIFAILSFVSILPALAFKLPLTIESPELFPGMVIPMHFFPALGWFTLKPLFIKSK